MIKPGTLLVVLYLLLGSILAQTTNEINSPKPKKFLIGMSVGLNITNVKAESGDSLFKGSSGNKVGFFIRPTLLYNLSPCIQLKTGIAFSNKGFKVKDTLLPGSPYEVIIRSNQIFHYLSLPVLVKASFIEKVNGTFYMQAGGYLGYTVFAYSNTKILERKKYSSKINIKDDKYKVGNSRSDDITPFDVGLVFGIGLDFTMFDIGVTYELGLSDITPDPSFSARNRALRFSVTIKAK